MLFDAKMQLVWVNGPIGRLTDFLERCCLDAGTVHPARALDNMAPAAGYTQPDVDEEWAQLVTRLETAAGKETLPLAHPCEEFSPRQHQLLDELERQLAESDADLKLLNDQLDLCRSGSAQFEQFVGLDVPVDQLEQCRFVKVRFGCMPQRGLESLQRDHSNDCLLFLPCAQNEKGCWGVCLAPMTESARIDGILAELMFEPVHLPGAAGTPAQIVENLNRNIQLLEAEQAAALDHRSTLWQQAKPWAAPLYALACRKARVEELRRCAAVRGERFFYCVWLRQPDLAAFEAACRGLGQLNLLPDRVLARRAWEQEMGRTERK